MWKVLIWFAAPIACYMIDPRIRGANAPLTPTDFVMGAWMLWTVFAVVRVAYMWKVKMTARAWYSQRPRG